MGTLFFKQKKFQWFTRIFGKTVKEKNMIEEIEKSGPLSAKNYPNYKYHLDSTYSENNKNLHRQL